MTTGPLSIASHDPPGGYAGCERGPVQAQEQIMKPENPFQNKTEHINDDEEYDHVSKVGRAFSVISLSRRERRASEDSTTSSVATAHTMRMTHHCSDSSSSFKTDKLGGVVVGERSGKKRGGSVNGNEEEEEGEKKVRGCVSIEKQGSWWARVRGKRVKGVDVKSGRSDTLDEKDMKVLEDTRPVELEDKERGQEEGEDRYPDGGLRAWLIVFGAMCNTFSTFGYVNSWGIFQAYYQRTLLKDMSPSSIAWIGSIQYALVFFPALIVGRLFDIGYFRPIFLASCILLILATFLVAECKEYWQFLLCQGITVGLACGGIFGPTTAVVAHWFKKRRGLAMGLVAVGSSIGGTVLPIAAKSLIDIVGFKWTMRIMGFILIFTLGMANLVIRRRLPPRNVPGGLLNLAAFRSPAYTIYCLSAFTTFLGIYTVLTYIDVSASSIPGVSSDLAFYLVAIANASSLFGRYASGVMCDIVGAMNVMIPFTLVTGFVTYSWPYARGKESLVGVAIVYGFSSGSYVSLLSNPLMEMGDTGDVGRRLGMFMSILALGALGGPPISGAVNKATGGFEAVGWYAGSAVLLGVAMMVVARRLVLVDNCTHHSSMLVVGLTGGIATGKSTVSKLLQEEHRVSVIDADLLARQVVEPGTRAYRKIVRAFGSEVLLSNGSGQLDRKRLGQVVFGDERKRRELNRIVHPEVRKGMVWEVVKCWVRGERWCVVDVPLLVESGIWRWVGQVVVVYCPADVQLERLMKRDGSERGDAKARLNAQLGIEDKVGYADVVLDNSGQVEDLKRRVEGYVAMMNRRTGTWWTWLCWIIPPLGLLSGMAVVGWRRCRIDKIR
ncbi:hypothetical protein AX17_002612 [Amanita inopinata Kibby_2008]|nr:hypothetical protein AX17_002612 [Amanita inopinata Kibby_2008]